MRRRLAGLLAFVKLFDLATETWFETAMLGLFISWLLQGVVILIVAQILPGVKVHSFGTALVVALVLGVLNAIIGPILTFIGTVLTLPAVILTLGLFYFVVRFLVNVFLLRVTTIVVPGFSIRQTSTLLVASLLISLFGVIVSRLTR